VLELLTYRLFGNVRGFTLMTGLLALYCTCSDACIGSDYPRLLVFYHLWKESAECTVS